MIDLPNFVRILYFLGTGLRRLRVNKEKLEEYQNKHLRAVVKHAYTSVPFYHDKFRKAGILPDDIRNMGDLEKLPVTTKDELRKADLSMTISDEHNVENLKPQRTSGSTGKPFKFYISSVEDDWRRAIYLRANISCGQRPLDKWVFVTAPLNFINISRIQRSLGFYAPLCISVFGEPKEQVRMVSENKPDVLDGYSGALLLLAREMRRSGRSNIHPQRIFGSADMIDLPSRKYLEDTFNAPYHDQFGCSEVQRTAWQCPKRNGYHMDVDSVITQFVDSEGNQVSTGTNGEIVQTSLFNFAMPFIRYSTGDIGRASADECSCGRTLPLMEVVEGRRDSFIVLPDGSMLSPRAFTVAMSMFKDYEELEQFRIVQKKPDYFDVSVVLKANYFDRDKLENNLESHLLKVLNMSSEDFTFDVKVVEKISLGESGKLMAVSSEVSPERTS